MSKHKATNEKPENPARQQLIEAGASPEQAEALEAKGLGGAFLQGLLKKLAPLILQAILDAVGGIGADPAPTGEDKPKEQWAPKK